MDNGNPATTYEKTNLLIENAVLKSSVAFRKEVDETLEKQQGKTEQLVRDLHADYTARVDQVAEIADTALKTAQAAHDRTNNIWAKVIALSAGVITLGGFLGFFIEQIINKK